MRDADRLPPRGPNEEAFETGSESACKEQQGSQPDIQAPTGLSVNGCPVDKSCAEPPPSPVCAQPESAKRRTMEAIRLIESVVEHAQYRNWPTDQKAIEWRYWLNC